MPVTMQMSPNRQRPGERHLNPRIQYRYIFPEVIKVSLHIAQTQIPRPDPVIDDLSNSVEAFRVAAFPPRFEATHDEQVAVDELM